MQHPAAGHGAQQQDMPVPLLQQRRQCRAPEQLLLRTDEPVPGIARVFAMTMGEQTLVSFRIYAYGEQAERMAAGLQRRWGEWLSGLFPSEAASSGEA